MQDRISQSGAAACIGRGGCDGLGGGADHLPGGILSGCFGSVLRGIVRRGCGIGRVGAAGTVGAIRCAVFGGGGFRQTDRVGGAVPADVPPQKGRGVAQGDIAGTILRKGADRCVSLCALQHSFSHCHARGVGKGHGHTMIGGSGIFIHTGQREGRFVLL